MAPDILSPKGPIVSTKPWNVEFANGISSRVVFLTDEESKDAVEAWNNNTRHRLPARFMQDSETTIGWNVDMAAVVSFLCISK